MSSLKGTTQTKEHKNKRIDAIKRFHKDNPSHLKGKKNPHYGKKQSKEAKQKISESQKKRLKLVNVWNKGIQFIHRGSFKKGHSFIGDIKTLFKEGKEHPQWLGGKSFEPYTPSFNRNLKKLIKERDRNKCIICNCDWKRLHVHHIDYNKKNCNPQNLVTLCSSCHIKTNHNRDYWRCFFNG